MGTTVFFVVTKARTKNQACSCDRYSQSNWGLRNIGGFCSKHDLLGDWTILRSYERAGAAKAFKTRIENMCKENGEAEPFVKICYVELGQLKSLTDDLELQFTEAENRMLNAAAEADGLKSQISNPAGLVKTKRKRKPKIAVQATAQTSPIFAPTQIPALQLILTKAPSQRVTVKCPSCYGTGEQLTFSGPQVCGNCDGARLQTLEIAT